MKICVFGAGAIGGAIAARWSAATFDGSRDEVSVVARGAHLQAIRDRGLRLIDPLGGDVTVPLRATDNPGELGPQDVVVVALKGYQLAAAAEGIGRLLGPHTRVVFACNGLPWWYFYGIDAHNRERRLGELDPDDTLWRIVGPDRVIGCVAFLAAAVEEPGVVRLDNAQRFVLGDPGEAASADLERIAGRLRGAGWTVALTSRIRDEIWLKLQGNAAFSSISVLTGADLQEMTRHPLILGQVHRIMAEIRDIGTAFGARFSIDIDQRIANAGKMGPHKPSMLQDLEKGRSLEIDGILNAPLALARAADVSTPTLDAIYALVALRAQLAGVYGTAEPMRVT
jgi:2-dehydropantoate 2-reductase